MTADGHGVGVEPDAAIYQDERASGLLELVLERNPFQRARVEALELGERPSLAELPPLTKRELVADQGRHPPFGPAPGPHSSRRASSRRPARSRRTRAGLA